MKEREKYERIENVFKKKYIFLMKTEGANSSLPDDMCMCKRKSTLSHVPHSCYKFVLTMSHIVLVAASIFEHISLMKYSDRCQWLVYVQVGQFQHLEDI